ncbi:MAG: N-acetyltransferase [Acidobacteria bacterium]|nr:N-acetyltransferase [Acidobacteriota bacterium]
MNEPQVETLTGEQDLVGVMEVDQSSFATPWTRDMYEAELRNAGTSCIAVLRIPECRVAGYCSYWLVVDEVHINNVAVRVEFRRRGFGRTLVEHVLHEGFCSKCGTATPQHDNSTRVLGLQRLGRGAATTANRSTTPWSSPEISRTLNQIRILEHALTLW